ncbi:MAG: hypothetical protein K2X77_14210 [Candidatus Obscuribacterales bacterium]|nr:hypothetical protein [Candidatus Obscuribacterales bacterium]
MARTTQIALATLFVAITFLLAAIQIPHIGEGAPDWHTVKNPQIPVQSVGPDEKPPAVPSENDAMLSEYACKTHPPIKILVTQAVCVSEPVYGWKWDASKKDWVRVQVGTRAAVRYLTQPVTAYWIDSLHCYAFYDNYGRLRMLPDYRALAPDAAMKKGNYAILLLPEGKHQKKEDLMLVRPLMPSQMPKLLGRVESPSDALDGNVTSENTLLSELADLATQVPENANAWLVLKRKSDLALLEETLRKESGSADSRLTLNQKIGACLISSLGSIAVHDLDGAISSLNKARRFRDSAKQESLYLQAALEAIGLVRELTDELEKKLSRYNRCI